MRLKILAFLMILGVFSACSKKKKESNDYNKGNLTVYTDDSFKSVVTALADAYMMHYPETQISVEVKKEDLAFLDLLDNKIAITALSKPLDSAEINVLEKKTDSKYHPDFFAADGVLFVVPKQSDLNSISVEEIKKMLYSEEKKLIFDGNNSSNLNFVAAKFNAKPADLKYSIINGNQNVINELNKYTDKIGVVSLNTISRPYDKASEALRSAVKILPVEENGKLYKPEGIGLLEMKYPFVRKLYFLNRENGFGIAHGFVRFACTQIGQMVVEKEGLQPYNLYKREVQMR